MMILRGTRRIGIDIHGAYPDGTPYTISIRLNDPAYNGRLLDSLADLIPLRNAIRIHENLQEEYPESYARYIASPAHSRSFQAYDHYFYLNKSIRPPFSARSTCASH